MFERVLTSKTGSIGSRLALRIPEGTKPILHAVPASLHGAPSTLSHERITWFSSTGTQRLARSKGGLNS